jgi:hypothetical protein
VSSTYRKRCLREKGAECMLCGATDSVVAHHIDGDRLNNSLDNLIPVCRSCHGLIHAGSDGFEHWYQKLAEHAQRPRGSIKDERQGIRMFLPEDLHQEFNIVATELDVWRRRRNEKRVEKIRHFQPLIISLGLEAIENMDDDELEKCVSQFDP